LSRFISRREFLRSAGGITFLALLPVGPGLFAAPKTEGSALLPLFTVLPYIQPGPNSVLKDGEETMVVAWQTQPRDAEFSVEYGPSKDYGSAAKVTRASRGNAGAEDGEGRYNYSAMLTGLNLGRKYYYRVRGNGRTLAEGYVTTRRRRGQKIRFVAFGDNSFGDISDRAIAYQAYKQNPDFIMNSGDNVYDDGLDNEYQRFFFPVYNADTAGEHLGAPLLRSVPFYTVIANHDVHQKDANKGPVADFTKYPDSLAYFTAMHLPLNGPEAPKFPAAIQGDPAAIDSFKVAAAGRFPRMANYSFDYGDAHFLCLDSNVYVDPTDAGLQEWIASDLSGTDALWKFVVFHHPPFNVGMEHYQEQHMRVLAPLFEKHGVDIALHGHEHTYQRPRPFKFQPSATNKAADVGKKDRRVPGKFTVDSVFDGKTNTRPDGVLYIVTGAGGKHLYDPEFNDNPASWKHEDDGNEDYVVKMVTDRHSLTVFDIDGKRLSMAQIDETGQEFDRITITKA